MTEIAGDVDLLSRSFAQDPHCSYRRVREDGLTRRHVVKTLATALHAWVVTDYDDARALLADARLAKDVDGLIEAMERNRVHETDVIARTPRSMLFSDPPDHTRLRKLVTHAFTTRRVERLRPWIEDLTERLLDQVPDGEGFDLVDVIANALPILVIGQMLGVPQDRREDFRRWNGVLASLETSAEEKKVAHGLAFDYLRELIRDKRANPGDDMISALIAAEADGTHLDEPELLASTFLLMNAGYETTAHMISSGVLTLLENPEQQRMLRADPSLLPGAIEEFLRYESPLNMATARYTAEPATVGEVTIPAGEVVFISLLAANRDPRRFPDPDVFDVARPNRGHLSFGHGIHHCIGAPLARMEGQIVFSRMLARFPRWEAVVADSELEWKYSAQFRGLERLPVRFHTR
jgi:cytochrome P450